MNNVMPTAADSQLQPAAAQELRPWLHRSGIEGRRRAVVAGASQQRLAANGEKVFECHRLGEANQRRWWLLEPWPAVLQQAGGAARHAKNADRPEERRGRKHISPQWPSGGHVDGVERAEAPAVAFEKQQPITRTRLIETNWCSRV
jgi:hypothetical protein